jgi:23S rRNA (uracil1939-C5)-methyltransferase
VPDVPYSEQLARKRAELAACLGVEVPAVLPSPREAAFRQKVAFVFGSRPPSRTLVMGHYERGCQRIVPIDECPVHSSRGNRIAFALRDLLAGNGVAAAGARGGILRHVIIRTTEDESQAVALIVVTRNDKSLRAPIRSLLRSVDRPDGLLINVHDGPGPYMIGPETIRIDGRTHIKEVLSVSVGPSGEQNTVGLQFLVSPTTFFQTNVGAARELIRLVANGVRRAERVLDLYSGSGLFTLPLAICGASVTAVEEDRQAIEDLKANLKLNRIAAGRVRPICAPVEQVLPRLSKQPWDAVVLDPPRAGCSPPVLSAIFDRLAPTSAVYVSCNPEALGRELPTIRSCGYRVKAVQAVDMFPHTEHIETVVVLQRR